MERYQVTMTVTKIDSKFEEHVELPKFSGSVADFFRALAAAADRVTGESKLRLQVRDDTTTRFAIKKDDKGIPYDRGSAGYYVMGKVLLGEEAGR